MNIKKQKRREQMPIEPQGENQPCSVDGPGSRNVEEIRLRKGKPLLDPDHPRMRSQVLLQQPDGGVRLIIIAVGRKTTMLSGVRLIIVAVDLKVTMMIGTLTLGEVSVTIALLEVVPNLWLS